MKYYKCVIKLFYKPQCQNYIVQNQRNVCVFTYREENKAFNNLFHKFISMLNFEI